MKSSTQLQQLSRDLLRDFLILKQQGYPLGSAIVLYGGPETVRNFVAEEITRQMPVAPDSQIRVSVQAEMCASQTPGFAIDLDYFLRHLEEE